MGLFVVPPLPPPGSPSDNATTGEVVLWSKRVSSYLVQLYQFMEQNIDAYIATSTQLGTDLIGTDNIVDSAVTSAKIEDSGVTSTDLGPSSVTTAKYENSSITTIKLIDSAVTSAKLENSAVTNAELVLITTDAATAHATVGASVIVTYAISRDKKPMVVPQVSAAGWLASLAYVATDTVEITAFNNSGATSCTVYANYH